MTSWEERMSARAAARAAERKAEEDAEVRREVARRDKEMFAQQASMTLAEAVGLMRIPPFACACVGGAMCCRYRFGQAWAIVGAAHIAVKMVAEVANRCGIEVD